MHGFYSFDGSSKYERDPHFKKIEQDIFSKMSEIVQEQMPESVNVHTDTVRFVSFEEALKELIELTKKN